MAFADMYPQLNDAWPLASYPFLAVLPTSEILVVAGMLVQSYTISSSTFQLAPSRSFPARPDGIPWTYPQTGVATLLPMDPANNYAAKVGLHSIADLFVSSPVKTCGHVELDFLCQGSAIASRSLRLLPDQCVLPQVLAVGSDLVDLAGLEPPGTSGVWILDLTIKT